MSSLVATGNPTEQVGWLKALVRAYPSLKAFIPRPFKWLAILLLIINARSWPFMWHLRVLRPAIYLRLYGEFCRTVLRRNSRRHLHNFLTSHSQVGKTPFEVNFVYKTFAALDDCDFNLHLSNSSYGKNLDVARLKGGFGSFLPFVTVGGNMALGATHFAFVREIPMLSRYQIHVSMGGYDHKWIYVVSRFVTYPSKKQIAKLEKKARARQAQAFPDKLKNVPVSMSTLSAPLAGAGSTPSTSGTSSPLVLGSQLHPSSPPPLPEPLRQSSRTSPLVVAHDGSLTHCVAVSTCCFKYGRITVPPVVALASCGFGLTQDEWEEVLKMRISGEMKEFLKGGWRNKQPSPGGRAWWLLEHLEDERRVRTEPLVNMREGLETIKELYMEGLFPHGV